MKFRAELSNASTLQKLISSLSPISKTATLKLSFDNLHLICKGDGQVQVWSQIKMRSIFELETLKLESNTNNEIYLELSTEALSLALKSAKVSKSERERVMTDAV